MWGNVLKSSLKVFFFRWPFPIFFCLYLSFLFALLFSLSCTTHILSVAGKKLDVNNG